ncbi:SLC26A/SulP transporter family protein [Insolitispirillum peregrinum]|uniref:SLC26A/SulP transporter family protein n=1 Tax=Insolitispirillum peregrinum TaxID=80876 RepID=UPI00361221E0
MLKRTLGPAMVGLIAGIDNLGASLAFAALLFPGALSAGLGMGVGVLLLSGVILALVIALRSSNPNTIAMVQETSIAILASSIVGVTATMTTSSSDQRIATVFAVLGTSTVLTGACFWLFGTLRLGGLVRFLPYPVVAGFLAGSGWLLIEGAAVMLSGSHQASALFSTLADPLALAKILPAGLFAVALLLALRRSANPLIAPLVMVGAGGVFYALLAAGDVSTDQARAWSWLPTTPADGTIALPSPVWVVQNADWRAVLATTPAMASAVVLSMIGLLLNSSGLELSSGRDLDANAELRSSGLANLLSGLIGGTSGFVGLGMTLLADKLGVHGRAAGMATACVLAIGLLCAPLLAALMPTFLAAGLMIFLGLELLLEWLVASRHQLPRREWLVVAAILLAIMLVGFLAGLALGLAISVVMFVYTYSRLPVVRMVATGTELRSSVDRSTAALQRLNSQGQRIHVLQLQGYLFFGTVERVVSEVRERLQTISERPLQFLLLDLRAVSGADSAATAGFLKICTMADAEGVTVIFSHLSPDLRLAVERAGLAFASHSGCQLAPDIDHALEACEEALLQDDASAGSTSEVLRHLEGALGPHPRLPDLVAAMDKLTLPPGADLIRAGESADDIYVLGHGRVKVQITLPNGRPLRLRTMTSGAVVGEIALYLGGKRTADVVVETPSTIFRLGRGRLEHLEKTDSELALLFHRLLAVTLSEKLVLANRLIQLAQN